MENICAPQIHSQSIDYSNIGGHKNGRIFL